MTNTVTVTCRPCTLCSRPPAEVEVPLRVVELREQGVAIQDAWSDAPGDVRELLITGTHADCWERMFAPTEDEEQFDF